MRIVILDAKTLGDDLDLSPLKEFGKLTGYDITTPEQTLERIGDAVIILTNKVVITREIMQQCEKLGLICITATGMNNVDLEAAEELGITVRNVAGYSTKSVAQHTFAMIFYLIEQMAYHDRFVKSGDWSRSPIFTELSRPYFEIADKEWGIIGMGTIGKEVAKVATAFGAKVSYYPTSGARHNKEYPSKCLETLLSESDIVSIHAPLNEATENLINGSNLSLLKEGSVLLNLGRGGIVNEADIAQALQERNICFGTDVTAVEPLPADNPLMQLGDLERLLITPHIAWASKEARVVLLEGVIKNIRRFLAD